VPQLADELRVELDCLPAASANAKDGCKHLQLLNLGRPSMPELGLPGVTAPLVIEEQLPIALPLLEARNHDANPRNDVEVVTLHVGGNDVTGPITEACLFASPEVCAMVFSDEMTAFFIDLDMLVAPLREAAGPDAEIVLGTYDNPVPFCFLGGFEGAEELGDLMLTTLHGIIGAVAAAYDAEVADVFGTFAPEDFVGGLDCLHPTATGHDKVTEAFLALLGG
jgi:lysophospholipase L1-like esterase